MVESNYHPKRPPGLPLSPQKEPNSTSQASPSSPVRQSLINDKLAQYLRSEKELDYLTHIVFRMFERFHVPPTDPRRFRIEILFSNGIGKNPFKSNIVEMLTAGNGEDESDGREPSKSSTDTLDEDSESAVLNDLMQEIQIQNDDIEPDQDYLTLSTMEDYLVNYKRRYRYGEE